MKKLFYLMICGILFLGCKRDKQDGNTEEKDRLFEESAQTMISFISQIEAARDSLEVDSLYTLYQKKIIDINFSVSPETDLKMTEQENDSLFHLLNDLNKARIDKLESFAKTANDTIPENIKEELSEP